MLKIIKQLHSIIIPILIITALIGFSGPVSKASEQNISDSVILKSASELDYPPFALVKEDGSADGFSVDLLKEVTKAAHLNIDFIVGPWHKIKQDLADGKLDVLPLVSYSKERDKVFDFTAPYLRMHGAIFVRKDEKSIHSETDLKDKEVLVMKGDTAHEYAVRKNLARKLILTDTFEQAMKLLSDGKHDAVIIQQLVGFQLIKKLNISNVISVSSLKNFSLKPVARPLSGFEQKFCFAVKEGDKELLALLNEGLSIVIANGIYDELYSKWFGPILPKQSLSLLKLIKIILLILLPVLFLAGIFGIWYLRKEVAKKTEYLRKEIKERKRKEQEIRRFKTISDTATNGAAIFNLEGILDYVNDAFARMHGFSSQELIGKHLSVLHSSEQMTHVNELLKLLIEKGKFETKEVLHQRKDGSIFPTLMNASVVYDENGNPQFLSTTIVDITEFRNAEKELEESKDRFQHLFEHAPLSYQSLDINGNFIEVNETWLKLMGYERHEVIGKNFSEFLHPDWKDHFRENFPRFKAVGEVLGVEFEMIKKDGSQIIVSFHGKIGLEPDGKFKQTHCVFRDITDQQKLIHEKEVLEARLQHSQKMDAIGTLAGGIAHDYNNLLSVITGNISYALSDIDKNTELYEVMADIQKGAKQAQNLTKQLLTFARGGEPVKKVVNLNSLIKESSEFISRGSNSVCQFHPANDLWPVEVDTGQLNQVISNIIINAYQAMPDGGKINIITENTEIGTQDNLPLPSGKYIKIIIEDQGIGISKRIQLKIFDPYFSTKQKGSGLGLATAYSIIKKHGGHITVYSELDKGSVFNIYLPASIKDIGKTEDKKETSHKGHGKIMIMDDQEEILIMIARMLKRMGYECETVTDGRQAIETYEKTLQDGNPFDLVILDITIPGGMGGADTMAELLKIDPNVKAVVSSGYSNDPIMARHQDYGFYDVIPKPYTKSQLAELLNGISKDRV